MTKRFAALVAAIGLLAVAAFRAAARNAHANNSYTVNNLVSDSTDANLVNGWGISASSTSPWWVSDNGTDKSTLYTGAGTKIPLTVNVAAGDTIQDIATAITADGTFTVGTVTTGGNVYNNADDNTIRFFLSQKITSDKVKQALEHAQLLKAKRSGTERDLNQASDGREFRSYLGMKHAPPFIPETVERMPLIELSTASAPSTMTMLERARAPPTFSPLFGAGPIVGETSRVVCELVSVKLM